jgi:hypothetical protein
MFGCGKHLARRTHPDALSRPYAGSSVSGFERMLKGVHEVARTADELAVERPRVRICSRSNSRWFVVFD